MPRLFTAALFVALALPAVAVAGTVEVRLTGAVPGGPVMVQLCSEAEGLMRCARTAQVNVSNGTAVARFENVPAGRWGVAAFQDVNADGRLGFGMMGRPNEPWGYSRNAPAVMGPPAFRDAAVNVPAAGGVIPVALGL
ncbi:DUF2141 domain-containing protein [Brevundimonas sp.]|uniref:DUF2141 domain-containing protein n=1 Tax=Brevundimonas sp. TaxID=1871086 RepID=UPI00286B5BC0|nr:DUF2141 domain-containing protein [Brevundimonas sp.]